MKHGTTRYLVLLSSLILAFLLLGQVRKPLTAVYAAQDDPRRDMQFTLTEDTIPGRRNGGVQVQTVSPSGTTHTASLTTTIDVTFSGAIQGSSVTSQTVFIHGGQEVLMGTFSPGTNSFSYDPGKYLFPGQLVDTTVTTGVLDSTGSPIIAPYVWQFRTTVAAGAATFPVSYTVGTGESYSVAVGDIDNDNDLDAVIVNFDGPDVIWENLGFPQLAGDVRTFGSSLSSGVTLGDVDGDGDLDIVVANEGTTLEVFLNDGDGFFAAVPDMTFGGGNSSYVALGDLDADGDLDALVANSFTFFSAQEVWLNDGAGNFGTAAYATFGGGTTLSVKLGDLDADGDLDVVLANTFSEPNEVWLNDGTGSFGAAAHQIFSGGNTNGMDLGDLDGDGDLDAIFANGGTEPEEVWLNDGTGSFGAAAYDTFGAGFSTSVSLGDYDGDSDLDAFVANYRGEANEVWLNDGAGNFGEAAFARIGAGQSIQSAVGDFDFDGTVDVLVGNAGGEPNEIWLNKKNPSVMSVFPANGTHNNPADTTLSGFITNKIEASSVTSGTVSVHGGFQGKVNGDTDVQNLGDSYSRFFYTPTLTFHPGELVQAIITSGVNDTYGNGVTPPYVWQFRVAAGVGPAAFPRRTTIGNGNSTTLDFGDVDMDGDLDILTVKNINQPQEVWLNDGFGNFGSAPYSTFGAGSNSDLALGDLDHDGDLDALIVNDSTGPSTSTI